MRTNNYLAPIIAKLTYNGAANLVGTLEHPNQDYPDSINGNRRIYTGFGKWTHIAALGVENNLIKLGLACLAEVEVSKGQPPFVMLNITPLGRAVADYLKSDWNSIAPTLLDKSRKATGAA